MADAGRQIGGMKEMRRKKQFFVWALLVLGVAYMIHYGISQYGEWKESHSGVPDVVSSMSSNHSQHLAVIVNSSKVEDKKTLARELVRMCRENSFHSIKFSTDINGYPSELKITVYLNRKSIRESEPICEIEFSTEQHTGDYDIKSDADKFHLYLDGEEIDFYE